MTPTAEVCFTDLRNMLLHAEQGWLAHVLKIVKMSTSTTQGAPDKIHMKPSDFSCSTQALARSSDSSE
jgi:hypothetical protein